MSAHRDPWVLLGLSRTADDAEIKKAYRQKAREYHPDRNSGDREMEALFQEMARAYESIRNEAARTRWLADNEGASLSGNDTFYESFGPSQFTAARVERELARTAKITFREAFEGVNKEMTFTVDEPCDICGGSGAAPGYKPTTCSVCRGSGQIAVGRAISPCAKCDGLGYIIEHPCTQCHKGIMRHDSSFVISIPAGIRDGDVIKLPLQVAGRVGHSEIKVTVKVEPSAVFSRNLRNPADLEVIVPITYSEAALGASVKIPTPDRTIQLHIPPSTASGKRFRVSGKGMPKFGIEGERGDLYARVQLQVPEELSHAQKRLISELGTHDPEDLRTALFTALRH